MEHPRDKRSEQPDEKTAPALPIEAGCSPVVLLTPLGTRAQVFPPP